MNQKNALINLSYLQAGYYNGGNVREYRMVTEFFFREIGQRESVAELERA